jgi:hypothetical protein
MASEAELQRQKEMQQAEELFAGPQALVCEQRYRQRCRPRLRNRRLFVWFDRSDMPCAYPHDMLVSRVDIDSRPAR